jgi:hypothetical protein
MGNENHFSFVYRIPGILSDIKHALSDLSVGLAPAGKPRVVEHFPHGGVAQNSLWCETRALECVQAFNKSLIEVDAHPGEFRQWCGRFHRALERTGKDATDGPRG